MSREGGWGGAGGGGVGWGGVGGGGGGGGGGANVPNKSTCGWPHSANMGQMDGNQRNHLAVAPLEHSYGHLHQSVQSCAPSFLM